jgi:protease I
MSKRVAIIVETDFRDEEGIYPYYRLQEAGCVVDVVTDDKKQVFGKFGTPLQGTVSIQELDASLYDGVIIPGGNEGPDRLRINPYVQKFVREMDVEKKTHCRDLPWTMDSHFGEDFAREECHLL